MHRWIFTRLLTTTMTLLLASVAGATSIDNDDDLFYKASRSPDNEGRYVDSKEKRIFHLDFDWGRQVTNLTPQKNGSNTLVTGDYKDGFQVIDNYRLDIDPEFRHIYYYLNVTGFEEDVWGMVGLVPIYGRDLTSIRYAASPKAVKSLPSIHHIPRHVDAFKKWSDGDAINFAQSGGIVFFANVGINQIGFGPSVLALGVFRTYVERINDHQIFVRITDETIKNLSLQINSRISAIAIDRYSEMADSFSYIIDTHCADAQKVYNDLINGNIAPIQQILGGGDGDDDPKPGLCVERIDQNNSSYHGMMRRFFIGLPILFKYSLAAGKTYVTENIQRFYDGTNVIQNTGVHFKEYKGRFLDIHNRKSEVFYSTAYTINDQNKRTIRKSAFGQYVWTSFADLASDQSVYQRIAQLSKKTGLGEYLKVNIPSPLRLEDVAVELRMTFNEAQTLALLRISPTLSLNDIESKALSRVHKYFQSYQDPDGLCDGITGDDLGQQHSNCLNQYESETRSASRKMFKALREMVSANKAKDAKQFVKSFSEFGKGMLENQFTFQLGTSLVGKNAVAEYTIRGTQLSVYSKTFETSTMPEIMLNIGTFKIPKNVGQERVAVDTFKTR